MKVGEASGIQEAVDDHNGERSGARDGSISLARRTVRKIACLAIIKTADLLKINDNTIELLKLGTKLNSQLFSKLIETLEFGII